MLESLALDYAEMAELGLLGLHFALLLAGGLLGGLTNRSTAEIARAPHFVLICAVAFGLSCLYLLTSMCVVPALANGYLWVIVGLNLLGFCLAGFCFARIGMARARDASGVGAMGALIFIPLANLWLLFAASKHQTAANRATMHPVFTGGLGVFVGLVLTAASRIMDQYATDESQRQIAAASAAGVFDVPFLARTLQGIAAETQTPARVDAFSTLLRVEAEGHDLRYVYQVSNTQPFLTNAMRVTLTQDICTNPGLTDVVKAGAIVSLIYQHADGHALDRAVVAQKDCAV